MALKIFSNRGLVELPQRPDRYTEAEITQIINIPTRLFSNLHTHARGWQNVSCRTSQQILASVQPHSYNVLIP